MCVLKKSKYQRPEFCRYLIDSVVFYIQAHWCKIVSIGEHVNNGKTCFTGSLHQINLRFQSYS